MVETVGSGTFARQLQDMLAGAAQNPELLRQLQTLLSQASSGNSELRNEARDTLAYLVDLQEQVRTNAHEALPAPTFSAWLEGSNPSYAARMLEQIPGISSNQFNPESLQADPRAAAAAIRGEPAFDANTLNQMAESGQIPPEVMAEYWRYVEGFQNQRGTGLADNAVRTWAAGQGLPMFGGQQLGGEQPNLLESIEKFQKDQTQNRQTGMTLDDIRKAWANTGASTDMLDYLDPRKRIAGGAKAPTAEVAAQWAQFDQQAGTNTAQRLKEIQDRQAEFGLNTPAPAQNMYSNVQDPRKRNSRVGAGKLIREVQAYRK